MKGRVIPMLEEYDFSNARKNPYVQKKRQVTINLDRAVVDYFKSQAADAGIPYQTLINLYLKDCAANERKLHMEWN